jgi:hypothetical protein
MADTTSDPAASPPVTPVSPVSPVSPAEPDPTPPEPAPEPEPEPGDGNASGSSGDTISTAIGAVIGILSVCLLLVLLVAWIKADSAGH